MVNDYLCCHFSADCGRNDILISTVLFAFIHVTDLESIKFIFQYIALALPICVAYHYSNNNIYVVTIVHIINNLLSVLTVTYIFWL